MTCERKAKVDRWWESIVRQAQRAAGFRPTLAELEAEWDGVEAAPMSKEEINRIVEYVMERDGRSDVSHEATSGREANRVTNGRESYPD